MQLNRMFSRIRLARPYRLTTAHSRIYLQPRLASSSSKQIRSNLEQNNPHKIEAKLDKVLGDKSAEVPRAAGSGYTGDQFIDRKEGSGIFASTSTSSSSSSDSSDRSSSSSSSAFPSGSFGSSSSSSNERSPSYGKFSNERSVDNRASGTNFSDRTSQSSGSQFQPQSQSIYGGRSSEGYSGPRSADDRSSFGSNLSGSDRASSSGSRQSNDFGSDNKSSGRGGGSFGEMASKVADKVADTFSGGGNFSQTVNRMAEKVSDKLSGNSGRSSEDRSSSSYGGGDSNRTSTTSSAYSGNSGSPAYEASRSYESGREGGRSFAESGRESFSQMADKATDRVSSAAERASDSARSGIGETIHKISDKISDTFSGSQSSGDNAESRMMRSSPRRGRGRDRDRDRDSSLFNPFDLSSIFRGNFFDNFSDNSMRTDIIERDSDYRVVCDMPGVDKKNININLNNNRLEIYGERSDSYDQNESDQTVHRQERYFGSYTRQLLLPEDASQDMSGIKAKCENGVLTVTIPKSQRSSRNRYNINIE